MVIDFKSMLWKEAEQWAKLGHFAVLQRFLLRNGTLYQGSPCTLPRRQAKMCFSNSATLADFDRSLRYCEGMAVSANLCMPMHHAWCLDKDDKVVDVTWDSPEQCSYLGIVVPRADVWTQAELHGVYGVLELGIRFNLEYMYARDPGFEQVVKDFSEIRRAYLAKYSAEV